MNDYVSASRRRRASPRRSIRGLRTGRRDRRRAAHDAAVLSAGDPGRLLRRAGRGERQQTQPIRSARGLIYDRAGRPLAINIPSYVVKIRPADLPFSQRDAVVGRLSSLLTCPPTDIIEALDRYASLRFELVRIASDVPATSRASSSRRAAASPASRSTSRSAASTSTARSSRTSWATPARSRPRTWLELDEVGYLNDDQIGKTGVEATFEDVLRGTYGSSRWSATPLAASCAPCRSSTTPQPGSSLELTIDVEIQREAEEALRWATDIVDLQRGVVIVMNPQTGEVLAMVSLPNVRQQPVRARHQRTTDYQALIEDPNRPLVNFALTEQYPPGSTYKLVTGRRRARGRADQRHDACSRQARFLEIGTYKYWEWNRRGFGPLDIYGGFAHSSDTFFYQLAGRPGHRSPRPLGERVRLRRSERASTCRLRRAASSRPTSGSRASSASRSSRARSTRRASARATTRRRRSRSSTRTTRWPTVGRC